MYHHPAAPVIESIKNLHLLSSNNCSKRKMGKDAATYQSLYAFCYSESAAITEADPELQTVVARNISC